jgi:hypothetical protein
MPPPATSKERVTAPPGSGFEEAAVYDVDVVEPGTVATCPVPIALSEFQRTVQRLARDLRLKGTPQEAARELLKAHPELEGDWLAEVYRDRVLTLIPQDDMGLLTPEADNALRQEYARWCERRDGGDCLGLFDDGPYLRADDRRTLALALAFGPVLDETREALGRELSPRAIMASLMWAVGLYLGMWLVPEPATKGVAATLTVLLVAWLGVDTVWGLVDGWARMATQAHEATTFAELRAAGEGYAKVMGTDAARALILAVAALTGHALSETAAWVRSLPGYRLALVQFEGQGLPRQVLVEVERVEAVVASEDGALSVLTSPRGALAGAMLSHNGSASEMPAPQGLSVTKVIRHRGGNLQVILSNGQRWHLPRGKSPRDIPAEDPLGDELQAVANRLAKEWGPDKLSSEERAAIERALAQGKYRRARQWEAQARGRWVERRLRKLFEDLEWNRQGVDISGPKGHDYEVLAGTADNFGRHGRRMSGDFFRMIFF